MARKNDAVLEIEEPAEEEIEEERFLHTKVELINVIALILVIAVIVLGITCIQFSGDVNKNLARVDGYENMLQRSNEDSSRAIRERNDANRKLAVRECVDDYLAKIRGGQRIGEESLHECLSGDYSKVGVKKEAAASYWLPNGVILGGDVMWETSTTSSTVR